MWNWLDAYKPAASSRMHLLLAAMMWTVVGALLLYFGVRWVLVGQMSYASLLLVVAATVGLLKARVVLHRAAGCMVERIRTHGDGRCIGGFLSIRTWLFIAIMVCAGRVLRGGLLPRAIVGLLYVAVGTALLLAVRRIWYAWYCQKTNE